MYENNEIFILVLITSSKYIFISIYKTIILPVVLYGCETMVSYIKGGIQAKGI